MSITHTVTTSYKDQSANTITQSEIVTGNSENNIDDSIPISANHQIHWACTRANLQALCLYASDTLEMYTNDASTGSPQEHISLVAGQTKKWTLATDKIGACPFAGDVTTIYVTNATAGAVVFKIRAVQLQ